MKKEFYVETKQLGKFYRVPVKVGGESKKVTLGYVSQKEAYRLSGLIQKLEYARRAEEPVPKDVLETLNNPIHQKLCERLADAGLLKKKQEIPTIRVAVMDFVDDGLRRNKFGHSAHKTYVASVADEKRSRKLGLIQCIGNKKINTISEEDIDLWVAQTDLAGATIGKYLEAFRSGVDLFLRRNPEIHFRNVFEDHLKEHVYSTKMADETKREQDLFLANTSFVDDLMRADMHQENAKLNAEFKLMLQLQRWLGLRTAEVRILRWNDIADRVVTIRGKREGKKGSHVNRKAMRLRQSPLWIEALQALKFFRDNFAESKDVYILNEIADLRNKPEFTLFVNGKKTGRVGRWETKLDKSVRRIYRLNGYPKVIQPNHIWKKNRITELMDSKKYPASHIGAWMGDSEQMMNRVYQSFVKATRVAGRASVDSEWNSDAFELVQNAS